MAQLFEQLNLLHLQFLRPGEHLLRLKELVRFN